MTNGDTTLPVGRKKIRMIQHGGKRYLAGMSGTPGTGIELVKHHLHRDARMIAGVDRSFIASDTSEESRSSAIVVHLEAGDGHRVYFIDCNGLAEDITGVPWAIGSGREYAIGAMAQGADAEQAVAIAARFDPYTGGAIKTVPIESMKRAPLSNFLPLTPGLTP